MSKVNCVFFGFAILRLVIGCDWLKNLAPLSQLIKNKTKTSRDSLAHVFPRFVPATCICLEFRIVCVLFDWPENITLVLVLRHSIENCSIRFRAVRIVNLFYFSLYHVSDFFSWNSRLRWSVCSPVHPKIAIRQKRNEEISIGFIKSDDEICRRSYLD